MAKYKHMTLDERIGIQKGLKEKKSFIEIGAEIDRDASTVAKEIKSHLLVKETGTRSRPYNPCKHRYNCGRQENVCPQCIHESIYKWDQQYCANCDMACYKRCDGFEEELCRKLTKPPYVCNGCGNIIPVRCVSRHMMQRRLRRNTKQSAGKAVRVFA